MSRAKIFGISLPLLALATAAHAGTFTFETAAGATESGGNAVDARAVVTTGAGTVTVQLFNLLANPATVAQNISDFDFALSGTTSLGSLASSSGQDITVASNGTFTLGSTVATGWAFTSPTAGSYLLNVLGAAGPAHTILGAPGAGGTYSNANGSIAGNDPHNPFLNQSATFTLNITGVTANTTVSSAIFSFGTAAGDNVPGGPSSTIPEPVSLSLVGSGLLALGLLRKRLPRK